MNEKHIRERLLLDEYEIQHFEFSSSYFIKEFEDAINYTIRLITEEMEKCIARKLELSEEQKNILNSEISLITETYVKETEQCMKKHEESLRNIFAIPAYVLLPNDKIHEEYAEINEENLLKEVEQLKCQYLKDKSLIFLYEEEIKHIDSTTKLQEQVSKLLSQMKKISDSKETLSECNKLYILYKNMLNNVYEKCNTNVKGEVLNNYFSAS